MNKAEYDFQSDIMEKARTARGARNKRNGSRSKKCALPSDNLSKKELNALNGPVETYPMNEPMKWGQFNKMPEDLQVKYLKGLYDRFGVGYYCISKMLGISQRTLITKCSEIGYKSSATRLTIEQEKLWNEFIKGHEHDKKEETEKPKQTDQTSTNRARIESGTLVLVGKREDIAKKILDFIPREARVSITFEEIMEGKR